MGWPVELKNPKTPPPLRIWDELRSLCDRRAEFVLQHFHLGIDDSVRLRRAAQQQERAPQ